MTLKHPFGVLPHSAMARPNIFVMQSLGTKRTMRLRRLTEERLIPGCQAHEAVVGSDAN